MASSNTRHILHIPSHLVIDSFSCMRRDKEARSILPGTTVHIAMNNDEQQAGMMERREGGEAQQQGRTNQTRVYPNRGKPTRIMTEFWSSVLFYSGQAGAKMPETADHGFWHKSARTVPDDRQMK